MATKPGNNSWDHRLALDSIFWMAEFARDPEALWASGVRDFAVLTSGLSKDWLKSASALDVGCGIGRLIKPASESLKQVLGVDSSAEALRHAISFLKDRPNVSLVQSNGRDLIAIQGKFDFIYSFATLAHLTPSTFVRYLGEIQALANPKAEIRLQLYLGSEVLFSEDDSFSIRSYRESHFRAACIHLGLNILDISPLDLPFEGADTVLGRVPVIVRLVPRGTANKSLDSVLQELVSKTEPLSNDSGSLDEYKFVINRANELIRQGNLVEAERFIAYAVSQYKNADPETIKALESIRAVLK